MRLWSIHPRYLDSRGLVALWREALLAQKVLSGKTRGYKHHPQLVRFRRCAKPLHAMGAYLCFVYDEAKRRGYRFSSAKIVNCGAGAPKIKVTRGQIDFEFAHLVKKLRKRDPGTYRKLLKIKRVSPHPIFRTISGGVADWERIRRKG